MTKLQKRIITALTTGSLILQTALPVFAQSTSLIITGNGSDSTSNIGVAQTNTTTVVQSNVTSVNNDIDVDANTGGNNANDNTGGDVLVDTGDADVEVNVMNHLNSNIAEVEACDCGSDTLLKIQGNGTGSDNEIEAALTNATQLFQSNVAHVDNDVDVDADTGDNDAEDNTGGDVVINTGDADVEVNLHTMANANSARIMPGSGDSDGGSVELLIDGNGSDSNNHIALALTRANLLTQDNWTSIRNDVDVDADTGDNDAEDNTGGITAILTGDSDIEVNVLNEAGFNAADIGCDCLLEDVLGRIGGNGTDSDNEIEAALTSASELFQSNYCGYGIPMGLSLFSDNQVYPYHTPCFDNDLDLDGVTGDNDAEDNTGGVDGDPIVSTGDSDVEVNVENVGGSNVVGDVGIGDLPGMDSDFDFSFSFDLSDLLEWLAAHS